MRSRHMQGVVYRGPWSVSLEEWAIPKSPTGAEVLCRIHATGICGTDLGIVTGDYPASVPVVLGHESTGVVIEPGDLVESLRAGDRVAINPTYYCGFCSMCRTGRSNHCKDKPRTEAGVTKDGTLAELYLTEERFLHKFASHVAYEEAALTEPLSCVLTGLAQLRIRASSNALVIGAGPIGLLYAMVLKSRGIDGVILELSAFRRRLAESILGKYWFVAQSLDEASERLGGSDDTVDVVVDTTSVMLGTAIPMLRPGGQALSVGLHQANANINPGIIADRSLSIVGSIDSLGTFPDALRMIENETIPVRSIITHSLPLSRVIEGLEILGCSVARRTLSCAAEAGKIVILPSP